MPPSADYSPALDLPCHQAVYKGCTRDAHRVYQPKPHKLLMSIRCTPLVHGVEAGYFYGSRVIGPDAWKDRNDGRVRGGD